MSLYKTWTGKLRKRRGQVVTISTAGVPGSEFEQARQRIRESAPKITRRTCFTRAAGPQCVLHDWSVPDKGDVEDLRVVKNANPASWITVASLRAKRESPTMTLSHWTRFTCNRATRSEDAAITEQEWGSATVGERIPVGQSIDLGLDVAWKWDTTAMVPLWDRSPKFRLLGPATILVPPRDGNSLHPQKIKDAIESIHERNPIRRIVMDITHAHDIAAWARDELQVEVIEHSQGDVQQAIDYDRFMEALRGGTLHHSADPGLTSHVMNAIARELPNERHRFDRKSSSRDASKQDLRVIDALVASAMVHSEAGAPVKQASDLPPERADGPRPSIAGIREKQW